ncbi:assimilatory sulfite reductase (NADPH) hemoprotein subunit [Buchnera aphidicola str. APS (Acyrthosiphon pisum)]|uniref:Sulfite reductase [NADPH] hemoprotein beta-component n=2 Tax=Buchnera aphidicola TaxID=9 RepID=CYSI_BUCAI|nr:assimilatory sulfite reductase (NADPH) hemoprotein subunit [Buchnera aphidicola]B8D9K5.1 RecName: Full=Sulfite reductase [NADPH] hemoprotein beta-component; Short=SiR-HP; Short=SiRHP [Buchnera aphidicola str. 5A (Acyrthosiphon pisum)]P57502.1 RecName: Full=Sulfite reductase [NADPH] hemoprotein beta-component; Short=SiR-HP; Short=SiRHP [Buchnera aphidicola str. APS (Acyrthosiphon pisum)]pir/E84979/ sulfite reductase (NADPH2) (EC 1.8.1.2) [imported] - Buchnera sp. (strain APS) [Buchnera sp. (in
MNKKFKKIVTEKKLTDAERIKENSNYLRGTITDDLKNEITNGFTGDNFSLIRFHGMYQQDDRDLRIERNEQKLEPRYAMMLRCRLPGGVIKAKKWLKIDYFASKYTLYGTIRLTNRQTFQFHGILKKNLKDVHKMLHSIGLDSLATANDVNRNVLCTSNPMESLIHQEAYEWARKISNFLLPHTKAYAEIWLDQKKIVTTEKEPILGKTYLPRKFKTTVVIPPYNDVDLYANDMNFVAITKNEKIIGFNILIGGGLSFIHGNKNTWPFLATEIGYISVENTLSIAKAIVTTQRDWGNRTDRANAKTRYTINNFGLNEFKKEIEKRANVNLKPVREYSFISRGDRFGWIKDINNNWSLTLFIQNGRIYDDNDKLFKSGLLKIANIHDGNFRITSNQNIIISEVSEKNKNKIEKIALSSGLINKSTNLRKNSMACVSFPTCPLAMAEAERMLSFFITQLENIMLKYGVEDEVIILRVSGCPNGCGRSLLAEIGLIGKSIGRYNLYIGGNRIGNRIPKIYKENITEQEILIHLKYLIKTWSNERKNKEDFGDFIVRKEFVKEVINPVYDFWS